MKSLSHILGVSVILALALTFTNCTTDSDVVQVPENELESEDTNNSDDSGKTEATEKSSSSKKVAKSSSSQKSSAKDDDKNVSSSSATKKSSSSNKKDSDSKVSSSSKKDEAKSSSSTRKIRVPGIEDPDEVTPASSSSSEKADSTAVEDPESSSSSEEVVKDTIDTDTTSVIKDNNEMDKLDSAEQELLDSLVNNGDSSITKIDSLVVDKDSLDFDNNDYFCKAPDGSWYRLNESKAKTFWKLLWDLTVYIFTGHHYYDFTKACDELYMRPKQ